MPIGLKTGGRQKGTPNKRTANEGQPACRGLNQLTLRRTLAVEPLKMTSGCSELQALLTPTKPPPLQRKRQRRP
jgi:hypothetical protein